MTWELCSSHCRTYVSLYIFIAVSPLRMCAADALCRSIGVLPQTALCNTGDADHVGKCLCGERSMQHKAEAALTNRGAYWKASIEHCDPRQASKNADSTLNLMLHSSCLRPIRDLGEKTILGSTNQVPKTCIALHDLKRGQDSINVINRCGY